MHTSFSRFSQLFTEGISVTTPLNRDSVAISWLAAELPNAADQKKYAEERCRIAVTEMIGSVMEEKGISRAEMARRLGVTKGRVSAMFSDANLTLDSVAGLLWACDLEVTDLVAAPLGVSVVSERDAEEYLRTRFEGSSIATASGSVALANATFVVDNDNHALAA